MTRADFHIHTEHSPDSTLPVRSLVRRCQAKGLGLIAVTDHNSLDGALEAREVADFPVIVGEEVTTADGELTGLFLTEPIPRGLSALETARRIKGQGGLVSIPHPFDVFRRNVLQGLAHRSLRGRGLPQDLITIVERCIELDSAKRFADATALHNALRAAVDQRSSVGNSDLRELGPLGDSSDAHCRDARGAGGAQGRRVRRRPAR